ncbi:hypothetical protein AOG26_12440 [Pseudoalteromonas sp. UCD-33C]|nr:hypothetical protein AOG26_12440 [Pseudoalteromonas sp. UCD-33C]
MAFNMVLTFSWLIALKLTLNKVIVVKDIIAPLAPVMNRSVIFNSKMIKAILESLLLFKKYISTGKDRTWNWLKNLMLLNPYIISSALTVLSKNAYMDKFRIEQETNAKFKKNILKKVVFNSFSILVPKAIKLNRKM